MPIIFFCFVHIVLVGTLHESLHQIPNYNFFILRKPFMVCVSIILMNIKYPKKITNFQILNREILTKERGYDDGIISLKFF